MKQLLIKILLVASLSHSGFAQDVQIKNIFGVSLQNTDPHELLFASNELINFCTDTVGKNEFKKYFLGNSRMIAGLQKYKRETNILAWRILRLKISKIKLADSLAETSRRFLLETIRPFSEYEILLTTTFACEMINDRLRDLSTTESCDVGVTKYVLFVYDPNLYINAIRCLRGKTTITKFFPVKCTITDYDRPYDLRKSIRDGVLTTLNTERKKAEEFQKMYLEVKQAKLEGSND